MSLKEIIDSVGQENIAVEFLHERMVGNVTKQKDGATRITFLTTQTDPTAIATDTAKVGMVLWIPRDKWAALKKV